MSAELRLINIVCATEIIERIRVIAQLGVDEAD